MTKSSFPKLLYSKYEYHWETDWHQPDVESLKCLCSIFGISTDTLIGFENEQNNPLPYL